MARWCSAVEPTIRHRSGTDADPPGALPRQAVGRLLAVLFATSGLTTLADILPPGPADIDVGLTAFIAAVALVVAAVLWRLPWARWPRLASLAVLPVGLVFIDFGSVADPNPYTYGLPFVVAFLWVGATHRQGTSLATLPFATACYAIPLILAVRPVAGVLGSTVFTMGVCAVVGEALAWVMVRLSSAQADLAARRSEARFRALVQDGAAMGHYPSGRRVDRPPIGDCGTQRRARYASGRATTPTW